MFRLGTSIAIAIEKVFFFIEANYENLGPIMKKNLTHQEREIRALIETMIEIATKGRTESNSEPFFLIYCEVLDCAHKIQQELDDSQAQRI